MMLKPQTLGTNVRMSFSKIEAATEMPNLIEVQRDSYEWFLKEGFNEVLRDVSPIVDATGNLSIEFTDYTLDPTPRYSVEECKDRSVTYDAHMKVGVRLTNKATGELKTAQIFLGDFPLMTDNGTFVINGAERVIVSQLVRSPGMYYDVTVDKAGKHNYTAQVIPYRGAWLEYETDAAGVFYVKIDKNRKIPITVLIRALLDAGSDTDDDIFAMFGDEEILRITMAKDECRTLAEENGTSLRDEALKEIYKKIRPGEPPLVESAEMLVNGMFFDPKKYDLAPVGRYKFNKKVSFANRIIGFTLASTVVNPLTGEIVAEAGVKIDRDVADAIENSLVNTIDVAIESGRVVRLISNGTVRPELILGFDLTDSGVKEGEKVRYSVLADIIAAADEEGVSGDERVAYIKNMAKAQLQLLMPKHITKEDILSSINYMIALGHGIGSVDDTDHLGNKRLRCVGELLQNQMRIGMMRMDKNIRERMSVHDADDLRPENLINTRPVATAIREFFGSSPLSQFMDQNNPLAELTHKRRLSALGPGGLSRDRASFEVRDVHYTHYGRICPVETPEGPNIGLISYLASYAKVSDYGFLKAPYRIVDKKDGRVTDEVVYLTADEEDNNIVAQANEMLDENGYFVNRKVIARYKTEFIEVDPMEVDLMDACPQMAVSVAAGCIPFLENDDNTRALMGSNMQKQAVPLMITDSPIVATGMEYKAAVDSGTVVLAREGGIVERAAGAEIVILTDSGRKDVYHLIKYKRSNQGTCVNQRPVINEGDRVEAGQVIADGPATANGEVSLGKNALIGFMTWEGYNYEDAVLLNEKLVREDMYTSIHIEKFTKEARDTKLGAQEITREVPNVSEDALKNLDADGIIRIGTEVRPGDILVGMVTPKGETELTPEERLLRAIFGEKAREVKDSSLKMRHGEYGVVVDVKIYDRSNSDELAPGVNKVVHVYVAQKRKISVGDKMAGRHGNKGVVSRILPPEDMPFLADGTPLDIVLNPLGVPSRMNIGQVLEVHLGIACRRLGIKIMTPVFDGAKETDILELLRQAKYTRDIMPGESLRGKAVFMEVVREDGKPDLQRVDQSIVDDDEKLRNLMQTETLKVIDGKVTLYDGRTGDPFDNPVTVGIMYYLKLHHLVDDKIHARSIGSYSLVTQQPLGGKAQFGGQRFGEMEVWALEAYGAAYTLQEILTVKSDDITGRTKTYEAIVKGQNIPTPGVPESFKVLVKELQALCLDVRVLDENGEDIDISGLYEDDTPAFVSADYPAPARDGDEAEEIADDEAEDGEDEDFEGDLDDEFIDDYLADEEDEISDIFKEEADAIASAADGESDTDEE
ncbi:MAG: DNA-directed RNA polymerase subunit beta [Clostridia bacterium]|nr:DNA-directed RNA polymerase subunit beta [Clostridia bacterium]